MRTTSLIISILFCIQLVAQNTLLFKQAEEGSLQAQLYLGDKYLNGDIGYEKNQYLAYKYYNMAALQGNGDAQYMMFAMLWNGVGIEKDHYKAIDWLKKSASQNHKDGLFWLGKIEIDNNNYDNGFKFLKKFEDLYGVNLEVCQLLGSCYFSGLGTSINYDKAGTYFLNSLTEFSQDGDSKPGYSAFMLGQMHQEGLGTSINLKEAESYYQVAIKQCQLIPAYWEKLGEIYIATNRYDKAKEVWKKVIELNPSATRSQSSLAVAMSGSVDYFIPSNCELNDKTYAIVIANENYKRVPNVPYAINDGKIFHKYLMSSFGVPEGNIEYLEDASLNDIKYALGNVAQRCQAFKDQCSVIVYYAGHGVPDDKTAEAFLLPVDGFGTDPSSGLNLDDFYATLSEMQAKSVVVLLDACFSGAKRDGGMLMATRGITIKPKMHVPDGKLIVLSATSNEETAFPIEDQKHGLFTYTLLRKIQETGGDITWGELADHVTETVKNRSIDLNGKLQTPTVSVSSSMKEIWRNLKLR